MRGNPDVGNFPACGSPGLVTTGLSRRRAYRRAYVASPRLTTTDAGLTPRLAYARVVHTAPGAAGETAGAWLATAERSAGRTETGTVGLQWSRVDVVVEERLQSQPERE